MSLPHHRHAVWHHRLPSGEWLVECLGVPWRLAISLLRLRSPRTIVGGSLVPAGAQPAREPPGDIRGGAGIHRWPQEHGEEVGGNPDLLLLLYVCTRSSCSLRADPSLFRNAGISRKLSVQTFWLLQIVAIPWRAIITSGPVWACVIMAWGGCFGFYALLTELPTYLANIQHFDMSNVSRTVG